MPSTTSPQLASALDILIVEDDMTIAANLMRFLTTKGHRPDIAYDGQAAIQRLKQSTFDAIVLDLGLPRVDGIDVLSIARQQLLLSTPILILTARDAIEARLQAFSQGADDYLAKPFALAEVEARVVAQHRRAVGMVVSTVASAGALRFDRRTRAVSCDGRPVRLTARGLLLLERLMRDPGELVERAELERVLWPGGEGSAEALRSQIYLPRKALNGAGYEGLETVHGLGLRLRA